LTRRRERSYAPRHPARQHRRDTQGNCQRIRRAGDQRLLAFPICDWLVPTTDPFDVRGMMGEGVLGLFIQQTGFEPPAPAGVPKENGAA